MLPIIIIPAYQPEAILIDIVKDLCQNPEQKVIIVDDGSSSDKNHIFVEAAKISGVDVLRHAENLGKGSALKTGFNHFLLRYAQDSIGVVTADADGQHVSEDIQKVSQALIKHPQALIVGARKFKGKIPFRSRFGNAVTSLFFKFIVGVKLSDTQSGLRAIPKTFIEEILEMTTSGYDFELDMLMRAARHRMQIMEIPIHTIYLDKNKTSHFNPLIDSLKIYFVFIRFTAISIISAILDFVLFSVCYYFVANVFASIIFARVLSGIFNFVFGKCVTFRSRGKIVSEGVRFIILAILLVLISYGLITSMVNFLGMNVYFSKVISEGTLFFMSFAAQRVFVFRAPEVYADVLIDD
ncbi:MAG: bifunctional glycosyltransferase family 2/GtrA family protein [Gammaproteobacteria bacterium]|jgi:glycosyltransferase involved in cell wall biosynthesis